MRETPSTVWFRTNWRLPPGRGALVATETVVRIRIPSLSQALGGVKSDKSGFLARISRTSQSSDNSGLRRTGHYGYNHSGPPAGAQQRS